jgi:cobalt-precorrin-7 (C5)-methyltransferase
VKVVGVGCGPGMITIKAIEAIKSAKKIYGSIRAIEIASPYIIENTHVFPIKNYNDLKELEPDAIVLSTGDPMLAGLGQFGSEVVPGISSMQYTFSTLRLPMLKLAIVDAHNKDRATAFKEISAEIINGKIVFILTDPSLNIAVLASAIDKDTGGCDLILCEMLGYAEERIVAGTSKKPPVVKAKLFSLVAGYINRDINNGDR